MGHYQPHADTKNFSKSDRHQDGFFTALTADIILDSSSHRILFLKENMSSQRYQADKCRISKWANDVAKLPLPQTESSDANPLKPRSKSASQLAPHQIHLKKTWCANSTSCDPSTYNSVNVLELPLSPSILSPQETSSLFLHQQINSAYDNKTLSFSPKQLISSYDTSSKTHLSTEFTTTPQNEKSWQRLDSLPEIPPPPFDINELWDLVRDSNYAELTDPSCISNMSSAFKPSSTISVADVRQGKTTLETVLNIFSQASTTSCSIDQPNAAAKLPSTETIDEIARSWTSSNTATTIDLVIRISWIFGLVLSSNKNSLPGCTKNDESSAKPSERLSDAHELSKKRYMARKILEAIEVDKIIERKHEHPPRDPFIIAQTTGHLYWNCFGQSGSQEKTPELSIWFGLSAHQTLNMPKRYVGEFLRQAPGLTPDLDFFAGFLGVKFETDTTPTMHDSWAREARNVLLSHISIRRCDSKESKKDRIAFVRSLRCFGYIVHSSKVEMWMMTIASSQTSVYSKSTASQSSSRRPGISSTGIPGLSSRKQIVSEPAPQTYTRPLEQPAIHVKGALLFKPEIDQPVKSALTRPRFLASYFGVIPLNTSEGVRKFIEFDHKLKTWAQNDGYRRYVATVHNGLGYSGPLQDTQPNRGLHFMMSEPDTMTFLDNVRQEMEEEEGQQSNNEM